MSRQAYSANRGMGETGRRLRFALIVTGMVFIGELVGGILSGSLALVSDALHVLFDASALALSLFALYLSTHPPSERRTYGLHRMEVFAAFINGSTLLVAASVIMYEAYRRFAHLGDHVIHAKGMTIVAVVGLVANAVVLAGLTGRLHRHGYGHTHEGAREHHEENDERPGQRKVRDLNLHSAILHVASDLLASVGVVMGGVLIWVLGQSWAIVDPILAVAIALLILFGALRLLYRVGHILMEGVPEGIRLAEVAEAMASVPGVKDVHHLHIWSICSNLNILSAHVVVGEAAWPQQAQIAEQVNRVLRERYQITDTTLQVETVSRMGDRLVHDLEHPPEETAHG